MGIIANPASGKDIRRLVAFGSAFDNQEKVRIVRRVLLGLKAVGVDQVCYMPDYYGIVPRALDGLKVDISVASLNFDTKADQRDSVEAARIMEEKGATCIVTLGGDGTNRVVAKGTTRVPILPISTGTNNVFSYMIEATVAGLAAGLIANRAVPMEESTFSSTRLDVKLDGRVVDMALIDVAVCEDLFVASRAVWDMRKVRQVFFNRAEPGNIGLSAIGGQLHRIRAEQPQCLYLELGGDDRFVRAAVAPGLIEDVPIKSERVMNVGEEMQVCTVPSVLALDGEREVEVRPGQHAAIYLAKDGPVVVDVARTMSAAMTRQVFAWEKCPDMGGELTRSLSGRMERH
ncbi:ATP-NAD kinase family protein [Desulfomonile tiedjei]|uniref:ATP-NAD kinase family protein n=1 Tax=Desulfomonile tiedjei TaxID=2358 RepID=UPI0023519CE4|nr:NAD(+)/NADH kinase [Desulfomonile tiedjei]